MEQVSNIVFNSDTYPQKTHLYYQIPPICLQFLRRRNQDRKTKIETSCFLGKKIVSLQFDYAGGKNIAAAVRFFPMGSSLKKKKPWNTK